MKRTVVITTMVIILMALLTGCHRSSFSNDSATAEKVAQLEEENQKLKERIATMEEKNPSEAFEKYKSEDWKLLEEELEALIRHPTSYEPREIIPLFYYICGNTDVIKEIYNGNPVLAEAIVETHMYWAGEFKITDKFIKTWVIEEGEENSVWNEMINDKCIDAFYIFKVYPKDLKVAAELLPAENLNEILAILEKKDGFPDGITKDDFKDIGTLE